MADIEQERLQLEGEKLRLETDKLAFEKSKFDSEAKNRDAEIAKAIADARKINLDADEMEGPFWKRPAWVTPVMQGIAVMIAIAGTLFSFELNRKIAESESAANSAKLQASQAQLETAQAKLDTKQAEIDKQKAVDQEGTADQKAHEAKTKLERVQHQIITENKQLDALKKQKNEASAAALLDSLGDDGYISYSNEKELVALLSQKDPAAEQRVQFLQSVSEDSNAPTLRRLAALRALFEHAQLEHPTDKESAATYKEKFIKTATSSTGGSPYQKSKWEALEQFIGEHYPRPNMAADVLAAGPYVCDAYQNDADRDHAFNDARYSMALHIANFLFEPKCASAQWDLLDPRMDVVREAREARITSQRDGMINLELHLPRELVLARYTKKVEPRDRFGFTVAFNVLQYVAFVDFTQSEPIPFLSSEQIDQTHSLHLIGWAEPHSHRINWRQGEDFAAALKKWPAEHQDLANLFSEPGLTRLRKCNTKVLQIILLDDYVGEPEIEENCPAGTLR